MAVQMIIEVPGMTLEQYERLNELMTIHGDEDEPDGLISHVAGSTGDGVLVADVWESQEQLDRFYAERLGPALAEAGVPEVPPQLLPVHNLIPRGGGERAGVIVLLELDGFGTDTYDALTAQMDAHTGDPSKHPAFSHAASKSEHGLVVVDVWESPEAFGRFAEGELGPAAAQAGHDLSGAQPRVVPVHYRLTGKS